MQMIIKNGHVIDPGNLNTMADIYVDGGKIVRVESVEQAAVEKCMADCIIDASGCIVAPGLIDMHVHLREPGDEYKEHPDG